MVSPQLARALSFLGSAGQSYSFLFADWERIEQTLGFTSLATPNAAFMFGDRLQRLAPGIPAGESGFDLQPSTSTRLWGAADVAWDAAQFPSGNAGAVAVTGFRPGFDMSLAEHHLASCGFTTQHLNGYVIYVGSSVALACDGPLGDRLPGPPDTTFGFSPQERLVVMSADPTAVRRAIAMRASRLQSSTVATLIRRLGDPQDLELDVGPALCKSLADPAALVGFARTNRATVARAARIYPPGHPYAGLGYEIQLRSSSASADVVFHYENPGDAAADLRPRVGVLRSGTSLATQLPYSNLVSVTSATATGDDLVLRLGPPGSKPFQLGAMFGHRDVGFARCG
jgi:hypothetical protein